MEKAKEIIKNARSLKRSLLEHEAKEVLISIGIPAPMSSLARNIEEAEKISESTGYPVALKVVSPQIIHKTNVGGTLTRC